MSKSLCLFIFILGSILHFSVIKSVLSMQSSKHNVETRKCSMYWESVQYCHIHVHVDKNTTAHEELRLVGRD